jgi:hypothetical protein
MATPLPKVEIGFDITGDPNAPFITLNDPVKGLLGSTEYVLGGTLYYDVTEKMIEISVTRGKNRQLDLYDVGLTTVVLQNNDRTFDPTFANSPYAGQIIPKRPIRITSAGYPVFIGVADDWNLSYEPNGNSIAALTAADAFAYFFEQILPTDSRPEEKTGERLNALLSADSVRWPNDARQIDTGAQDIIAGAIPSNQSALNYFQKIAQSEPGAFFISRDGKVVFKNRYSGASSTIPMLADDGSGIPYVGMRIQYGSELLYNEIVIGSPAGTAITTDLESVEEYGVLNLSQTDLLIADLESSSNLATFYASKYSQPEYRFESVDVLLDELPVEQQNAILNLEVGDYVAIKFTPNGIPPAIERFAEVIRISHGITQTSHIVSLGFSTVEKGFWRLSDPIFGRLSSGNSLAY